MVQIDDYDELRTCVYGGESYSVRDNGAIMRHAVEGKRKRPNDEKWTFGKPTHDGYLLFCGIGVHRIVATAFHGQAPSCEYVCDHYDTNRQNNRPENLRWVTKLENILNNPYTREKLIRVCGSIESFLENPQRFYQILNQYKSLAWMRTVTPEEAKNTLKNMDKWLAMPYKQSNGYGFNGNVFKTYKHEEQDLSHAKNKATTFREKKDERTNSSELTWESIKRDLGVQYKDEYNKTGRQDYDLTLNTVDTVEKPEYSDSLTTNALQPSAWTTGWYFPNCPQDKNRLDLYYDSLAKGRVLNYNEYGKNIIEDYARTPEGNIIVKCRMPENPILYGCLTKIRLAEDGKYIHENKGTYWYQDGIEKYFLIEQGKEWTGGEVMDDYM